MNMKQNFGFVRKSGILLHISSLPSKYGIGSFGKEAYNFVDFLKETNQKCWQVLPLNPTSYGDSPYQSPSSFAGNPYFIDLETLAKEKLLTKEELNFAINKSEKIDYGFLFNTRYEILRKAYSRFIPNKEYKKFCGKNSLWLYDYALFMALKVKYNYAPFTSWDDEYKNVHTAKNHYEEFKDEADFWIFLQFEFMTQWQNLKRYANSKGIKIIGDIPIYVAFDSVDVWCNPNQFLLCENYNPKIVAGCPPDSFSADGQLWGNPIYNWDIMKENGFSWWISRISQCMNLYDIVRIDHFRGFAGFYAVPFGEETARNGKWYSAPGKELFDKIKQNLPKAKIIAEDLGFITEDVRTLLQYTGFPGMKILQFAFSEENSEYLPRMYKSENFVVYTGSHDSECTKTFIKNMSNDEKSRFSKECKHRKGQSATYDLIELAMASIANLSIIPMQDYLQTESREGRMNRPSVSSGNWQWRLKSRYASDSLKGKIREMTKRNKRA